MILTKFRAAISSSVNPAPNSSVNPSALWLVLALSIAIISRLVPHAPNWTALGALALWAGTFFSKKSWSMIVPLAALFVSDLILGFHSTMVWVYAGFMLVSLVGLAWPAHRGAKYWVPGSLLGSLIFFVVSNFGVWMSGELYPKTLEGLVNCFVMAIPFLWSPIAADLFFNSVFAITYALVVKGISSRSTYSS